MTKRNVMITISTSRMQIADQLFEQEGEELQEPIYDDYPEEMPELYYYNTEFEPVGRCVCDYISSMTDRYAIDIFKKLFMPAVWQKKTEY